MDPRPVSPDLARPYPGHGRSCPGRGPIFARFTAQKQPAAETLKPSLDLVGLL